MANYPGAGSFGVPGLSDPMHQLPAGTPFYDVATGQYRTAIGPVAATPPSQVVSNSGGNINSAAVGPTIAQTTGNPQYNQVPANGVGLGNGTSAVGGGFPNPPAPPPPGVVGTFGAPVGANAAAYIAGLPIGATYYDPTTGTYQVKTSHGGVSIPPELTGIPADLIAKFGADKLLAFKNSRLGAQLWQQMVASGVWDTLRNQTPEQLDTAIGIGNTNPAPGVPTVDPTTGKPFPVGTSPIPGQPGGPPGASPIPGTPGGPPVPIIPPKPAQYVNLYGDDGKTYIWDYAHGAWGPSGPPPAGVNYGVARPQNQTQSQSQAVEQSQAFRAIAGLGGVMPSYGGGSSGVAGPAFNTAQTSFKVGDPALQAWNKSVQAGETTAPGTIPDSTPGNRTSNTYQFIGAPDLLHTDWHALNLDPNLRDQYLAYYAQNQGLGRDANGNYNNLDQYVNQAKASLPTAFNGSYSTSYVGGKRYR